MIIRLPMCNKFTRITIIVLGVLQLNAQILEKPIDRLYPESIPSMNEERGGALMIPFFDDFTQSIIQPNPSFWINNGIYINSGMSTHPISVQCATFDGLDQNGNPYTIAGIQDQLISKPIDLSTSQAKDSIALSFYVQPKGYGYQPFITDSFLVEIFTNENKWETVLAIPGLPSNTGSSFEPTYTYYHILLSQPKYQHANFQFRFSNMIPEAGTGFTRVWNLAYVYLNKLNSSKGIILDAHFVEYPGSILKNYRAMPMRQFRGFEAQEATQTYTVHVSNRADKILSALTDTLNIKELETNTSITFGFTLFELMGTIKQKEFQPGKDTIYTNPMKNGFLSNLQSLPSNPKYRIQTNYIFEQSEENSAGNHPGIVANNKISNITNIDNYYAYDDGTAERAVVAQKKGNKVAVQFTANTPDSIRGVAIFFPRTINNISANKIRFFVTGEDKSVNIYESSPVTPHYGNVNMNGLNLFTIYAFTDPTGQPKAIPVNGKFHIGWEQYSTTSAAFPPCEVGIDKNTPKGTDYVYGFVDGAWSPVSSSLKGAFMLRPILGDETPISTVSVTELPKEHTSYHWIRKGFQLELQTSEIEQIDPTFKVIIYNIQGQRIGQHSVLQPIDIRTWNPGTYVLSIFDSTGVIRAHQTYIHQ